MTQKNATIQTTVAAIWFKGHGPSKLETLMVLHKCLCNPSAFNSLTGLACNVAAEKIKWPMFEEKDIKTNAASLD